MVWSGVTFWDQLGYGLILGGAIGNGIDRFIHGYVVDFLDVRLINFAVFNLADVFINIGIACLLISTFQKHQLQTTSRFDLSSVTSHYKLVTVNNK